MHSRLELGLRGCRILGSGSRMRDVRVDDVGLGFFSYGPLYFRIHNFVRMTTLGLIFGVKDASFRVS